MTSAIVTLVGMSDVLSFVGLQALLMAVERALQVPQLTGLRPPREHLRPAWALGACTSPASARAAAACVVVARRGLLVSTSQALPAALLPTEHGASFLTAVRMCI